MTSVREPKPSPGLLGVANLHVLYLFTGQARMDAGGSGDVNDDDDVVSRIYETFGTANEVFDSSGGLVRLHIARIARLDGYTPTGDPDFDLKTLRANLAIQAARDLYSADVVAVIVRNGVEGGPVDVCGWAFVQRPTCADPDDPPIPNCGPGVDFNDWAYHFAAVNCLSAALTHIHELLHNMGGEHNRGLNSVPESAASYVFRTVIWGQGSRPFWPLAPTRYRSCRRLAFWNLFPDCRSVWWARTTWSRP